MPRELRLAALGERIDLADLEHLEGGGQHLEECPPPDARRKGVGVTPASAFAVGRAGAPDAVRVCLGAARDRAELERGLRVLADLLAASPEPAPLPSGP